jgi:LVIVD repeat
VRYPSARLCGVALAVFGAAMVGSAQHHGHTGGAHTPVPSAAEPAGPDNDPRVGLKAGLRNAGTAIRNLELVTNVPKPAGFFDPKDPAGLPTGPEIPESDKPADKNAKPTPAEEAQVARIVAGLNFANSDLAFSGHHLFVGNFNGFTIYDIANPAKPKLISSVVCPGGQGDVSVHGTLLVMSVEQTRGRLDCGTQGVEPAVSPERFRGVRVFDIKDLKKPVQVAAVQTCRGSHTHTLVRNPKDPDNLYVYGSGTSSVRSAEELAGCSGLDPKEDPNTALFSIDVIQIPIAAPATARIVSRPRIFADSATGSLAGLWAGGTHGPGTQKTSVTNQCHDITVFPEIGLAAGACSGNGILLDISDPVKPVRLDSVVDKNFAYWHSATFNNDGTKVLFTDEWGGGTRPRCRATDLPNWGANAIFDIADRKLKFAGYYKIPAPQSDQENCVAHNGSLVPVPGRDIMVQAWYQGGLSMFDFTESGRPVEIAFFDRGPLSATELITGGFWSTYWYNGYIYGTEIARGIDILRLKPSEHLSQNEIDAAKLVVRSDFNAQEQPKITWPAVPVVARAYLDQLARTRGIAAERVAAVKAALDRAERAKPGDKGASAVGDALTTLAAALAKDAGAAAPADAGRLRALAANLETQAVRLR